MNAARALPRLHAGGFAVWRRNALVWRKLMVPSLLINFGEPFLYLLGLGYGLGLFIGDMMQMPYLTFLASGILASSSMNTASFEAMYSVYTRMVPQRTYDAILASPLEIQDILAGEWLWTATKCVISGSGILLVATLLGAVHDVTALWVIPVLFVIGLCFGGMALVMTAFAPGYDYFNYYFTLLLTPMFILSGVFYPVSSLPDAVQGVVQLLPLTHAVDLVRALIAGRAPDGAWVHIIVLLGYGIAGFFAAIYFVRRRLIV